MIEVTALTKRYGSLVVLDGIDFAVQAGEIAAVVGPSGAGKSTLARCINLLDKPTSGSIRVDGKDLTRLSRRELRSARRAIGTVFQSASLLQRMTAAENVALPMRYLDISHRERVQRVRELLDRVEMLHRADHYPSQLSGGQQQRIGLARGLALKPSVLLADEPTSGLDPQTTSSILKLLAELRDELRVAVVLITHEMDVVRNVADSVARLHEGKIVERGAVAEVVRSSDSELARALLPLPPGPARDVEAGVWQLRYERPDVDPAWLTSVARELDTDISVLAGLIETIDDGGAAGRVTVRIERPLAAAEVREAFASRGIHAALEGLDRADELEPEQPYGALIRSAA
ncbi:MAG TPA: methionine ABC transporter ATP-binding protein [Solirubrobacteraceae bacterium]|nr:methionine ABC transporter ATP-binding protein [Solirubrobacteraceae bacterium]